MIILLSGEASADRAFKPRTRKRNISANHHDTIESSDHFCEFLLQNGLKAGEEATSGSEVQNEHFSRMANRRRYRIDRKTQGTHHRPIDLMMGSIPVVERY